jgi:hypothetical protein
MPSAITTTPVTTTPAPATTPVVAEQLTWPNTIELSEQATTMTKNPLIASYYAKAEQSCTAINASLKTLEQTITSIKDATNQKLNSSSASSQLVNVDIGKLIELFNPREKKQ